MRVNIPPLMSALFDDKHLPARRAGQHSFLQPPRIEELDRASQSRDGGGFEVPQGQGPQEDGKPDVKEGPGRVAQQAGNDARSTGSGGSLQPVRLRAGPSGTREAGVSVSSGTRSPEEATVTDENEELPSKSTVEARPRKGGEAA
jgi:hypothetical protein